MIPDAILNQASALVEAVGQKKIRPRRSKRRGYKVLNVNYRWRLVNKQGNEWELMSHEKYNKAVKR